MTVANEHKDNQPQSLKILEQLEEISAGHLVRIIKEQHRIKLIHNSFRALQKFSHKTQDNAVCCNEIRPHVTRRCCLVYMNLIGQFPLRFFSKKDGSIGFCVAHRKLNTVTVFHSHKVHSIDSCIDALEKVSIFTTIGANADCWKVMIGELDHKRTASISHHSLNKLVHVYFRLHKALSTFPKALDVTMISVK